MSINKKIIKFLDNCFYSNYKNNWDDLMFRKAVLKNVNKSSVILDIGAGAGIVQEMNFSKEVKEVHGVDPDERVVNNPNLTHGYIGTAENMDYFADNTFDLVICDNVLEHISDCDAFLNEVKRVLKPGCIFMAKTPNYYHYMPIIASLTPDCFHEFYNKLRGRTEDDTFPTLYRLNTKRSITKAAKKTDFSVKKISYAEGRPEYLRISFFTYLLGIIYERFVNIFRLNCFKIILICELKKNG